MRFAHLWAQTRRRLVWKLKYPYSLLVRSASIFFPEPKAPNGYRNLGSAGRLKNPILRHVQKNPSDATNKRNSELYNPTNIGSRKHAVFATHRRSARPLQQRAGLKYFSDSCYK